MAFTTLVELYRESFTHHPRPNAFRHRLAGAWRDVSSADAWSMIERIAAALAARGIAPGERVGLLAENRLEWALADYGILTAGAATVPVYPTLTAAQAHHILADSGARLLFVSTPGQMEKALEIAATLPALLAIVVMDLPAGAAMDRLVPWDDLLEEGRAALAADPERARRLGSAVGPADLATLIYTSGTTGPPKGVMLTHANLVSNVEDALRDFTIGPADSVLSILPLSHILERMAGHFTMLARSVSIAYADSPDTAAGDLLEVRPTIVFGVPRLFEKIHRRVLDRARAGGPLGRAIFSRARAVARACARRAVAGRALPPLLALERALYDRLVYAKLRQRVGGRIRFFVSGGAPLALEIAEFFLGAGLPVLEGYGLTETSPVIAVNRPDRNKPGTVGPPIANVAVRIAADGEILVQSPGVMQGYYHLPAETEAALAGGWFHTGDIGHLDADGCLVITDRKKDLLVTAGGKNVAPQPIESLLKTIKYVAEAVLVGDRRPFVSALIVPNFEQLEAWARYKGVPFTGHAELLARPEVLDLYRRRIAGVSGELARFEQVRKFRLLEREFSIAGGELTPTLKVRRRIVNQNFADLIEDMYREAGVPDTTADEGGMREPHASP